MSMKAFRIKTHEIVDFGPGPEDHTQDYPFQGTEQECSEWLVNNQVTKDGRDRFAMQEIPEDN